MKKVFLLLLFAVASCATPVQHNTPSGKPEVTIESSDTGEIKSQLVNRMIDRGYTITRDTDYLIAFDRPVDAAGGGLMVGLLFGSRYDGTPNARISFTLSKMGDRVRVVADMRIVTNPGSAFERTTEVNQNADSLGVFDMLRSIKRVVESQP